MFSEKIWIPEPIKNGVNSEKEYSEKWQYIFTKDDTQVIL